MPFTSFRRALFGVASASLFLALAPAAPALAGALNVDPVRIEINADRRTASVTVRNEDKVPVTIRAYPLAWTQAEGKDVYAETGQIIVSPPIFTIPAGGTQIVRVGLRNKAAERASYRLMIEEVPEAGPAGGVQVALRLNLPLFAMLPEGALEDLHWSAYQSADGWTIEAVNTAQGHVRVEPAEAALRTGIRPEPGSHFGVVLPGGSRRWAIGARPDIADPARFRSIHRTGEHGLVSPSND